MDIVVANIQSEKHTVKNGSDNTLKQVLIKVTAKEKNDSLESMKDKGTSLKYESEPQVAG